jgi:hypothetical protein
MPTPHTGTIAPPLQLWRGDDTLLLKAISKNWFRSENEDLRMDGEALEVSSIERNSSDFSNEASRRQRPFVAEIEVVRGGPMYR